MSRVLAEAMKIEYPEVAIPDKPSQLLREVVEDMRQVSKHSHVKFDMTMWCNAKNTRCTVCAAGAWMYSKMGFTKDVESADKFINMMIDDCEHSDIYSVMGAIDYLRETDTFDFLYSLEVTYPDVEELDYENISDELDECFPITYNSRNAQSVMAAFNKCAKVLESYGL